MKRVHLALGLAIFLLSACQGNAVREEIYSDTRPRDIALFLQERTELRTLDRTIYGNGAIIAAISSYRSDKLAEQARGIFDHYLGETIREYDFQGRFREAFVESARDSRGIRVGEIAFHPLSDDRTDKRKKPDLPRLDIPVQHHFVESGNAIKVRLDARFIEEDRRGEPGTRHSQTYIHYSNAVAAGRDGLSVSARRWAEEGGRIYREEMDAAIENLVRRFRQDWFEAPPVASDRSSEGRILSAVLDIWPGYYAVSVGGTVLSEEGERVWIEKRSITGDRISFPESLIYKGTAQEVGGGLLSDGDGG